MIKILDLVKSSYDNNTQVSSSSIYGVSNWNNERIADLILDLTLQKRYLVLFICYSTLRRTYFADQVEFDLPHVGKHQVAIWIT